MKPIGIDLCCGLGGWTDGLLAEGYDVIGFDIEAHAYGEERYRGRLVLQDVLALDGAQFKDAALIVASPPCQDYSYMAMPWSRAKAKAAAIRADTSGAALAHLNRIFDACFRIEREASAAAGHHIPMVLENVRGAQPWVGAAKWNFGSFYLWGDVPALMPPLRASKNIGGSWFNIAHNTTSGGVGNNPDGRKNPGFRFDGAGRSFQSESVKRHLVEPPDGRKAGGDWFGSYAEEKAAGTISPGRLHAKHSPQRKAASAKIAKIPLPLSSWIARTYKPAAERVA